MIHHIARMATCVLACMITVLTLTACTPTPPSADDDRSVPPPGGALEDCDTPEPLDFQRLSAGLHHLANGTDGTVTGRLDDLIAGTGMPATTLGCGHKPISTATAGKRSSQPWAIPGWADCLSYTEPQTGTE